LDNSSKRSVDSAIIWPFFWHHYQHGVSCLVHHAWCTLPPTSVHHWPPFTPILSTVHHRPHSYRNEKHSHWWEKFKEKSTSVRTSCTIRVYVFWMTSWLMTDKCHDSAFHGNWFLSTCSYSIYRRIIYSKKRQRASAQLWPVTILIQSLTWVLWMNGIILSKTAHPWRHLST
jgi:hypothetical protein